MLETLVKFLKGVGARRISHYVVYSMGMLRENVLSADNQQGRSQNHITPWYVTGFVDGEGSFHIAIYKDPRMKTGWKVIPEFHVSQRNTSRKVLEELVKFFRCGYIKLNHRTNPNDVTHVYVVRNRDDLLKRIIPFFWRYELRTEKAKDFDLFATVVALMDEGQHRTTNGMKRIVNLAYKMNGGGRYRQRSKEMIM
jgi:hypothetical protein